MKYFKPFGITDPDASYINGDPTIGRKGSIPPAEAIEHPQRELVALIEGAKYTPTDTYLNQVLLSVRSQRMNYAVATNWTPGAQNAIAVAFDPPIADTMTPGMPLRVKPVQTNTQACTLRVDGIEYPLRRADGSECEAGDITISVPFECLWDDSGYWAMTNYRGFGTGGDVNTYITKIPYAEDTSNTANAIDVDYVPAITSVIPGDAIEVLLANNITGATTIEINALSSSAVVRPNGSPLQDGDGVAGQVMLLIRSNTNNWQFNGIVPQAFTGIGVPIGSLILALGSVAPTGTLKLNGALLVRSEHPGLWTYANGSGRIVDEVDWQNGTNHFWTSFSRGDGSTSFRLPDFRGEFMRSFDDGRGIDPARLLTKQQSDIVGQLTMSGIVNLNDPKLWMENTNEVNANFHQYTKDHWIEDGELAWRSIGDDPAGGDDWLFNITTPSGVQGGAETHEIYWVAPRRTQSGVLWPGGLGDSGFQGGHYHSRITSAITLTGSGGGTETRPRNAAITACIVDG